MRSLDCDSMEKLLEAPEQVKQHSMEELLKAIEVVKKLKITKAVKAAQKIMGDKTEWGAKEPEWIPFEKLREMNLCVKYFRDSLYLVHSAVEVWMVFIRSNGYSTTRHIISLLTGESYYLYEREWMIEADGSDRMPKTRSSLSTISNATASHVRGASRNPLSPLIKAIAQLT